MIPPLGGRVRLDVSQATWITGMRIQTAHGVDSKHGVKRLIIQYQKSRGHWNKNAQELVTNIFSTRDWEEVPKDLHPEDGITLHDRTSDQLVFKFRPILTDRFYIYILESFEPNQDVYINELELLSDCKLKLILELFVDILVFRLLSTSGQDSLSHSSKWKNPHHQR